MAAPWSRSPTGTVSTRVIRAIHDRPHVHSTFSQAAPSQGRHHGRGTSGFNAMCTWKTAQRSLSVGALPYGRHPGRTYGTLLAQGIPGSPLDSIRFVPEISNSAWNGILFKDTRTESILQYCSIAGAAAGVSIEGSEPTIEHNLIANCSSGIDVYTANPKLCPRVRYNEIHHCKYGMYVHNTTNADLRGNVVHTNDIGHVRRLSHEQAGQPEPSPCLA